MNAADRYAALLPASRLREAPLLRVPAALSELELQALWFSGEFGRGFTSTENEPVHIVQFGVWNREAGPDFAEAVVRIGTEEKRGSIELDTDARDWERHGHATDPAYDRVVLHLFFHRGEATAFTRTTAHRAVPQVRLDPAAIGEIPVTPVPLAQLGRCSGPLRALPETRAGDIIEAAAQYRLRKKAARLARLTELHGPDEALYQALAGTLGYKHNRLPFTLLAQRLPLKTMRRAGIPAEALLFGVAGFLRAADLSGFDPGTRDYLRALWEQWWPVRSEYERLALSPGTWKLSGVRPANHPQRRLAALAQLIAHWPGIRRTAAECDPRAVGEVFEKMRHPYWDRHYTLTSAASSARMALIGPSRVSDILANVLYPAAFVADPARWIGFRQLPALLGNKRVEIASIRLLQDHPARRALTRTAARQQGLLQIYEDFCMQDDSDCARCLFPRQLEQWEFSGESGTGGNNAS